MDFAIKKCLRPTAHKRKRNAKEIFSWMANRYFLLVALDFLESKWSIMLIQLWASLRPSGLNLIKFAIAGPSHSGKQLKTILLCIFYVIATSTVTKHLFTLFGKQLHRFAVCILHAAHFCWELLNVSSRLFALEQQLESVYYYWALELNLFLLHFVNDFIWFRCFNMFTKVYS